MTNTEPTDPAAPASAALEPERLAEARASAFGGEMPWSVAETVLDLVADRERLLSELASLRQTQAGTGEAKDLKTAAESGTSTPDAVQPTLSPAEALQEPATYDVATNREAILRGFFDVRLLRPTMAALFEKHEAAIVEAEREACINELNMLPCDEHQLDEDFAPHEAFDYALEQGISAIRARGKGAAEDSTSTTEVSNREGDRDAQEPEQEQQAKHHDRVRLHHGLGARESFRPVARHDEDERRHSVTLLRKDSAGGDDGSVKVSRERASIESFGSAQSSPSFAFQRAVLGQPTRAPAAVPEAGIFKANPVRCPAEARLNLRCVLTNGHESDHAYNHGEFRWSRERVVQLEEELGALKLKHQHHICTLRSELDRAQAEAVEVCKDAAKRWNDASIQLREEAARKRDAGCNYKPALDGSHVAGIRANMCNEIAELIRSRSTASPAPGKEGGR